MQNFIEFVLPEERLEDSSSWVELTFLLRYAVTPFRCDNSQVYDVDILDIALHEARAWIGDHATPVPLGDDRWEAEACDRFRGWLSKTANLLNVERLCLADYETADQIAREAWA